jgi:ectoine hydroxylase-related dioxygenase (phytanoyl-CoA dioxygenase family)
MIASQPSSYGVSRVTAGANGVDSLTEEVLRRGYVVADSGLSEAEIDRYRRLLDAIYAVQQEEVGGEDNLQQINDANVARCLLAYDDAFLTLAMNPVLLGVAERLLGSNLVLLMQNGVINPPVTKHYQINWHRDLNYQHWVCSRPLALSALFCLDRFSRETGGTYVLAGTHLKEEFPSEEFVRRHEEVVEARPGSVILFDSMLFHRAGYNSSAIIRRAVNHVVGVPILSQQISIPDMLQGRFQDDPFLARYLGYRWNPRPGVRPWRMQRLHNLDKASQRKGA